MSYTQQKSKFIRLPYEISKANSINDNFTVQFKPKYATLFRASDEYTKYIDDDYTKCLNASVINANAAADFSLNKDKGTSPMSRQGNTPMSIQHSLTGWCDATNQEDVDMGIQQQEEERANRMSNIGRDIARSSNDIFGETLTPTTTYEGP